MDQALAMRRRYRGISWAPVIFLLCFLAALAVISLYVAQALLHTMAQSAPDERKRVSAYAMLLMFILIAVLLLGLVATIRMGRSARRAGLKHPPTEYPDAWSESARRMRTPPPEMLEDDEDAAGDPQNPRNG